MAAELMGIRDQRQLQNTLEKSELFQLGNDTLSLPTEAKMGRDHEG